MSGRLLVLGLDCLGPEVLRPETLAQLPNLGALVAGGVSGRLASVTPPITVPAWTSFLTGRDPGELGIYGFRNRARYDYGSLVRASSLHVRVPRLWDAFERAGGESIVIGVPQTSPPPRVHGVLVSGFDATAFDGPRTYPSDLADELGPDFERYRFDVDGFRERGADEILRDLHAMLEERFALARRLLTSRAWRFAMVCEIGTDRVHHAFWRDHDPSHPAHDPQSPYRPAVLDFYRAVDREIGDLLDQVSRADDDLLVMSDHGAQPMLGGVCVNQVLIDAGWLVLHHAPDAPGPLTADLVDWRRTRAWAEGGYAARIFVNVDGREPAGTVRPRDLNAVRQELADLFARLNLSGGPAIENEVIWPERAYRRVRGCAPDLLVMFGGLAWRGLGTIGHGRAWLEANDAGVDWANHSKDGMFVFCGRGVSEGTTLNARLLDLAPALLDRHELEVPPDLTPEPLFPIEVLR
jgi:predicted AlkP superfamily phosphohydrolase/phosphomutase